MAALDLDQLVANIKGDSAPVTGNAVVDSYYNMAYNPDPTQSAGKIAAVNTDLEDERRRRAAEAEAARLKQEAEKYNPQNYRAEVDQETGGYRFFNGAGEEVDINTFAVVTNQRPDQILKDSTNPRDMQFVQDYQMTRALINSIVNEDREALNAIHQANWYQDADGNARNRYDEWINQFKNEKGQIMPGEMLKAFQAQYADFYGAKGQQMNNLPRTPLAAPQGAGYDPKQFNPTFEQLAQGTPQGEVNAPGMMERFTSSAEKNMSRPNWMSAFGPLKGGVDLFRTVRDTMGGGSGDTRVRSDAAREFNDRVKNNPLWQYQQQFRR